MARFQRMLWTCTLAFVERKLLKDVICTVQRNRRPFCAVEKLGQHLSRVFNSSETSKSVTFFEVTSRFVFVSEGSSSCTSNRRKVSFHGAAVFCREMEVWRSHCIKSILWIFALFSVSSVCYLRGKISSVEVWWMQEGTLEAKILNWSFPCWSSSWTKKFYTVYLTAAGHQLICGDWHHCQPRRKINDLM